MDTSYCKTHSSEPPRSWARSPLRFTSSCASEFQTETLPPSTHSLALKHVFSNAFVRVTPTWVARPRDLTSALSTDPEYFKNVGADDGGAGNPAAIDYKDWQISMSRRFRAIKLWVILRRYGAAGMRARIRRHVAAAKWFEQRVAADERFEVVVPRRFSLVCFRLAPRFGRDDDDGDDATNHANRDLLAAVNASGRAFMTHFVVDGKFVIRLAVGGASTELQHVMEVWDLLQGKAAEVLQHYVKPNGL